MPKTVTLRLADDSYRVFCEAAKSERRPLSNLIEVAALTRIHEQQFLDDQEMIEILGRENLLKRMKAGSRNARARKGRFVG